MGINLEMQLVENLEEVEMKACRDGFGEGLVEAGRRNDQVVVLSGDLTESTRVKAFKEEFGKRFFEMGVAEQNMMGVAAGMALSGKIPFVASYAVFSPGRNWDQLRVSVCYSKANVKVVGAHAGISTGADGATHQGLEDMAITRVLPNMKVVVPCDFEQAKKATMAVAGIEGPVYLRFGKNKTASFTTSMTPFEVGRAQKLREGEEITVLACGPLVYKALTVADKLKGEIDVEVINVHTIKPLDEVGILSSVKKTNGVVTVEEHQITGGLGGAVSELLSEKYPVLMRRVGVKDSFGESGEAEELLDKYGMGEEDIMRSIREVMSLKNKK